MNLLPWLFVAVAGLLYKYGLPRPTITPGAALPGSGVGGSEKISQNFTFNDVTASDTANTSSIANDLPEDLFLNAKWYADYILEPVTAFLGKKPTINSWYRSPDLNSLVGGDDNSDHLDALATDLQFYVNGKNETGLLIRAILATAVPFDQLIIYGGQPGTRVHLSLNPAKLQNPRRQVLSKTAGGYTALNFSDVLDFYL